MKVSQITTANHSRVVDWHEKAVNDPGVARFLSGGGWYPVPQDKGNDWETAYFMDETDTGLLTANFSRDRESVAISLYALSGPARLTAAFALLRFARKQLPRRYGMTALTFSLAVTNDNWSARARAKWARFCWGVEPRLFYDMVAGRRVDAEHYYIPVEYL